MDAIALERARATPLQVVLEGFGALRDPKDPKHNWKVNGSRITVTEDKFFDHNQERGGGGALDLTLHLLGRDFSHPEPGDFGAALRWLGRTDRVMSSAHDQDGRDEHRARRTSETGRPGEPPLADPTRIARVRWYLTEQRAIPESLVDRAIARGLVFADSKANAVFRLRDETGAQVGFEKRGTYDRPFHSVYGDKGMFAAGKELAPTPQRTAAFVESAIEALSYKALHPDRLALSTTGNAIELPERMGKLLLARGFKVLAAFNADRDGDRFAERFAERLGGAVERHRPNDRTGKDWNMALQAQRQQSAEIQETLAR